jgi:hypothetical protein
MATVNPVVDKTPRAADLDGLLDALRDETR